MAHIESNDQIYDLIWPWEVKVTAPIC